ncbi:hypothetical protein GCM10022243_13590 [Saccharothrix violaceirubra]|uniref:Uncharacterized protein n=1 Tax=Saccharothrix violaceirubra TaxID=413306 RepID=A0A7W7SZH4_9PSEU|nr:DUF4913 domain-containing protein [Saccharothrix violaceirubra]MBB4963521.1 hypothetical protein [Saccharothrix violaceirubra]
MTSPEHLRADLDHLTGIVEHLVVVVERFRSHPPGSWSWPHLDASRAADLWSEVADFVDHLNTREELGPGARIPPCWFLHGRAVEDLTALLAAWRYAYQATTPTAELIDYRNRHLWPTLDRLTDLNTPLRRCADKGRHTPWHEPDDHFLAADGCAFDRATELARHAAADVADRR